MPGRLSVWTVVCVACVAAAAGNGTAAEFRGDEPLAVRETLGGGIHAYFSGHFDRAYDELTRAIEAGASDPRSYYFRGLAALRLGRAYEAEADFTRAAELEIESGSSTRVSRSLERVQGHDRLQLERHRGRARLAGIQKEREAHKRRYSTIDEAAPDVRRRRRPAEVPGELVAPGALPAEAAAEEVPPPPAGKPKPAERKPAAEADDPFGDEPEDASEK